MLRRFQWSVFSIVFLLSLTTTLKNRHDHHIQVNRMLTENLPSPVSQTRGLKVMGKFPHRGPHKTPSHIMFPVTSTPDRAETAQLSSHVAVWAKSNFAS